MLIKVDHQKMLCFHPRKKTLLLLMHFKTSIRYLNPKMSVDKTLLDILAENICLNYMKPKSDMLLTVKQVWKSSLNIRSKLRAKATNWADSRLNRDSPLKITGKGQNTIQHLYISQRSKSTTFFNTIRTSIYCTPDKTLSHPKMELELMPKAKLQKDNLQWSLVIRCQRWATTNRAFPASTLTFKMESVKIQ